MLDLVLKRVIITGATSSLGIALIWECINREIEVYAIVKENSDKIEQIPDSNLVHLIECSLDKYKSLDLTKGLSRKCDALFHLAWMSTSGDQARNCLIPQSKNISYALNAVDLAYRCGCTVYIGAGSQAEYGRTNDILTENSICLPETAYGMAKLCAGQMTRLYCKQKGMRHIWTRILSSYGPNSQSQSLVNYTITELLAGRKPILTKCEQIWNLIYNRDVAKALLLLAIRGHDGDNYIIGARESHSLKEYMHELRDRVILYKARKGIISDTPSLGIGEKEYSSDAVMNLTCSTEKLIADTGFSYEYDFSCGIDLTIEWIANYNALIN